MHADFQIWFESLMIGLGVCDGFGRRGVWDREDSRVKER